VPGARELLTCLLIRHHYQSDLLNADRLNADRLNHLSIVRVQRILNSQTIPQLDPRRHAIANPQNHIWLRASLSPSILLTLDARRKAGEPAGRNTSLGEGPANGRRVGVLEAEGVAGAGVTRVRYAAA
jgi:hypothetical protein